MTCIFYVIGFRERLFLSGERAVNRGAPACIPLYYNAGKTLSACIWKGRIVTPPTSALDVLCSDLDLFDAEKGIVQFILDHPREAANMTSANLAQAGGASEATVSRLMKRLGFDGYRSFQLSLNRDIAKSNQPDIEPSEISVDNIRGSLQTILHNKVSELETTALKLDAEELDATLKLLREASIIQVAAVGNTIPVAMDAAFKFNQLGLRSITSEVSEKASAFSLTLNTNDLLLLISNSGKSRRLMQMAQVVRQGGVPIVLLTSETDSPLAKLSDHVLIAVNRERLLTTREFQLSRIPLTFIVEVLYYFLYGMLPDPKHHISRHESLMALDKEVDTPSDVQ